MTLLVYCLLLILVILYVNKNCNQTNPKEKVNFTTPSNVINQYNILNTDTIKPIIPDNKEVEPHDTYEDKYWELKPFGFSNIYNYQDKNSVEISIIDNSDSGFVNHIPKEESIIPPQETKKLLNTINFNDKNYNLLGIAVNEYYNQYYYIYENQIKQYGDLLLRETLTYQENQQYCYILVKSENNKLKTIHDFGPRAKININDIIYLASGVFELGPLVIKKIN